MAIERECKFRVNNLNTSQVAVRLNEIGFLEDHVQEQTDIYYDDDDYRLTNLKRGLRLRHTPEGQRKLEFKSLFSRDEKFLVEEEVLYENGRLDLPKLNEILSDRLGYQVVTDQDDVEVVLGSFGLKPGIILNKRRSVFYDTAKQVEASIDEIDGLDIHVEVEMVGNNHEAFDIAIESLKRIMGQHIEPVQYGYLELISSHIDKIMTSEEFSNNFKNNPCWNVLPTENEVVDSLFLENNS